MAYTCSLEKQLEYRKKYRDKNKARIAKMNLPKQKLKRLLASQLGLCIRCFKDVDRDGSYCGRCLLLAIAAKNRYLNRKRTLKKEIMR